MNTLHPAQAAEQERRTREAVQRRLAETEALLRAKKASRTKKSPARQKRDKDKGGSKKSNAEWESEKQQLESSMHSMREALRLAQQNEVRGASTPARAQTSEA